MKRDPNDGGCWFCMEDDVEMLFSMEFDSWFHEKCLREALAEHDPEAEIIATEYNVKIDEKYKN